MPPSPEQQARARIDALLHAAGIYKIWQTDIADVTFPVPPMGDAMVRIAAAGARQSAGWRARSQAVARRRRETAALVQSIFKAAFADQLVPQALSGEAAAALLARRASGAGPAPWAARRSRKALA